MEENNQVLEHQQEVVVRVQASKNRRNNSTKLSQEKCERLKKAWIDVKQNSMTLYGASKKYDVPVSTLWDWCQRNDIVDKTPTVGRPCFLGTALEDQLKNWIFEAARTGENHRIDVRNGHLIS